VIGNVIMQAIAHGRFASLAEARQYVAQHLRSETFVPRVSGTFDETKRRYEEIEARYI